MDSMLPSLSQILKKGAPGGHTFAQIVGLLFEAEQRSGGPSVQNFDDCSGDIDGADATLTHLEGKTYVQIKFYPSKLSQAHKTSIQKDYDKVKDLLTEDATWLLITPDELHKDDMIWFKERFGMHSSHKGYKYLTDLFLKHPHIGTKVYPNHEFRHYANEYKYPKNPEAFFKQFLESPELRDQLFLRSIPTLHDCRAVFTEEWAEAMFVFYKQVEPLWNTMDGHRDFSKYKHVRCETYSEVSKSEEDQDLQPSRLPAFQTVLRSEIPFYKLSFLQEADNESGLAFKNWAFINQRWVFFGKIYRNWRKVYEIKTGDDFSSIIRATKLAFRFTGFKKQLDKAATMESRLMASLIINELLDRR